MQKYWSIFLVLMITIVAGCEALRTSPDDPPTEELDASPEEAAAQLMESVEDIRNREFAEPLTIMRGAPQEIARDERPTSVDQEWEWLSPLLFGSDDLHLVLDDERIHRSARFDRDQKRLVFSGDPGAEDLTAFAVAMEANIALEELAFGELYEVETVDQWLSREITRRAGPAFVASVLMADRDDAELDMDDLSERPELLVHVPGLSELVDPLEFDADMLAELEPPEGTEYFEEAMEQLVLRKALSMGAALYRAGGWAAVEWGHGEPPRRTDQVVRIDKWFAGEGPSQWEWPEPLEDSRGEAGWEKQRDGRVGPALTALWLEGLVGPMAARTIYAGWLADTYRIYSRDTEDGEERALYWVSAWETPHDAQEIGAATEAVLAHMHGTEHRENRFRVAVQGLNVAVIIYDADQDSEVLDREVEVLSTTRVGFLPGEAAPFEFVPTLYERYVATAEDSVLDLDGGVWLDPASGWRAEVGALDRWSLQRSDEAHVRWFATHTDGSLIQWTTELVNPLGPEFASQEYLAALSEAFGESIAAQEDPEFTVVDSPVDPTIEMEIMGLIDGRPTVLHLWQWRRGDVIVTFSLQGMEDYFGDRLVEAEAVLDSLEPYGSAVEQSESRDADPSDDEGIIEFTVE